MKVYFTLLLVTLSIIYSCGSSETNNQQKIDDLQNKISELEQKEKDRAQEKKDLADQKKAEELQGKKNLIISQIRDGLALKPQVYDYDDISTGGINNGKLKIENDLVGIVFQAIKVRYTVYLANGNVYNTEEYTFTNLKPGESREKILFNTGNRGTKYQAVVTEIKSNWLTGGQSVNFD